MSEEPMHRSDWVLFLQGRLNTMNLISIGFFSAGVVLMTSGVILTVQSYNYIVEDVLSGQPHVLVALFEKSLQLGLLVFFLGVFYLILACATFLYTGRSIEKKLLFRIMKERLEVGDIERIYFPKKEVGIMGKIKDFIHKVLTKYWYFAVFIGFCLIVISFILKYYDYEITWFYFLITLGFGFISIGIACYSIKTSDESNRKMSAIVNALVLEIERIYEERRLDLLKKMRHIHSKLAQNKKARDEQLNFRQDFSFTIWMAVRDLKRIEVLNEFMSVESQKIILKLTLTLFNDLFSYVQVQKFIRITKKGKKERVVLVVSLTPENKKHLEGIMSSLRKIEEFRINHELRKQIIASYTKLIRS